MTRKYKFIDALGDGTAIFWQHPHWDWRHDKKTGRPVKRLIQGKHVRRNIRAVHPGSGKPALSPWAMQRYGFSVERIKEVYPEFQTVLGGAA